MAGAHPFVRLGGLAGDKLEGDEVHPVPANGAGGNKGGVERSDRRVEWQGDDLEGDKVHPVPAKGAGEGMNGANGGRAWKVYSRNKVPLGYDALMGAHTERIVGSEAESAARSCTE